MTAALTYLAAVAILFARPAKSRVAEAHVAGQLRSPSGAD